MAEAMAEDGGRVPMSPGLQATLLRAREYAASQSEAEVLLEHLLLALSEDADAANVLESCQIDLSRLRHDVAGYIGSLDDRVPPGTSGAPAISAALTQVLKYATLAAQQGRRASIDGAIVLAALVGDGRSMAASFLKAQGLTFEAAIRALREVATRSVGAAPRAPMPKPVDPPPPVSPSASQGTSASATRTENILARARERVESRNPYSRPQRADQPAPEPSSRLADAAMSAASPAAGRDGEMATHAEAVASQGPGVAHLSGLAVGSQSSSAPAAGQLDPSARPGPPASTSAQASDQLQGKDGFLIPPAIDNSPSAQHLEAQTPAHASPPPPLPPQHLKPEASRSSEASPFVPAPDAARSQADGASAAGWWARSSHQDADASQGTNRNEAGPQLASWPEASRAAWPVPSRPPGHLASPVSRPQAGAHSGGPPTIDATMVSHSVPAHMKHGRPHVVEVRVERPPLPPIGGPPRAGAHRPDSTAARAIAVRLRPLAGRFIIDPGTPETAWDNAGAMGADRLSSEAAVWRFTVTPLGSGRGILQLSVSARTIGADGVVAETLLPDQAYEVRINRSVGGFLSRAGMLVLVAMSGMLALKLAEIALRTDALHPVKRLLGI